MRMRKLRGPNKKMSMPFEKFRTHTQPVNLPTSTSASTPAPRSPRRRCGEKGLATRTHPVKVLGNGDVSKKLTVRAHAFSATASEKIEAAGGSTEHRRP